MPCEHFIPIIIISLLLYVIYVHHWIVFVTVRAVGSAGSGSDIDIVLLTLSEHFILYYYYFVHNLFITGLCFVRATVRKVEVTF